MKHQRTRELKKVGDLFAVYKDRLQPPQASVVRVFTEVVGDVLNLKLTPQQVEYKLASKTLFLKAPGVLAQEIKLHQAELLAHLKGRLGEHKAPTNIR